MAIAWLNSKGVAKDLTVRDWKPKSAIGDWSVTTGLAEAATRGVLAAFGIEGARATSGSLDGLQSVWHLGREENPSVSGEIGR